MNSLPHGSTTYKKQCVGNFTHTERNLGRELEQRLKAFAYLQPRHIPSPHHLQRIMGK